MPKCPMCQSRIKRHDITCVSCGFALPSNGAPVLGPPPESAAGAYDFGAGDVGVRFSSAKFEFPVPVRRDFGELLGLVVAGVWIYGSFDSGVPLIFLAGLIFAAISLGPTLYAVLGRERALVLSDRLVVVRTVFGVTLRRLTVPVGELKDIRFVGGESGKGKRTTFWTFSRGTIRVVTQSGEYEFAEGFAPDSAVASQLAERLKRELPFPPRG
ncbi:MAG: hypothetical protein Q8K99_14530 [Actinomycetota bacterium]|nr:hypothetical protein [Actinomycetota bacterium]